MSIGLGTLHYSTVPKRVQVGYSTVHEMWAGGGGLGVNIGWGTLPWGVGVNIGWGTLPCPTLKSSSGLFKL